MTTRRILRLLVAATLVLAACGDDAATDDTTTTTPAAEPTTTVATTTTTAPTTTTTSTTTTTTVPPPPDGAWTYKDQVFVAGDCFTADLIVEGNPTVGFVKTSLVAIDCTEPHAGEVIATGEDCPVGLGEPSTQFPPLTSDVFREIIADYAGITVADVPTFLSSNLLAFNFMRHGDGDGSVITDTMCLLGGIDLVGSFAG